MNRIIPRREWRARSPRDVVRIATPTRRLWLHHLAAEWHGAAGMRSAQDFHMDTRKWDDFAYSFAVDDDGTNFEGRGAGIAGGHTKGDNLGSHAIVAMGDFSKRKPPEAMLQSIAEVAAHGHRMGWWGPTITGGHRDAPGAQTECCGNYLHARIPELRERISGLLAGVEPEPDPILEDTMQILVIDTPTDPKPAYLVRGVTPDRELILVPLDTAEFMGLVASGIKFHPLSPALFDVVVQRKPIPTQYDSLSVIREALKKTQG